MRCVQNCSSNEEAIFTQLFIYKFTHPSILRAVPPFDALSQSSTAASVSLARLATDAIFSAAAIECQTANSVAAAAASAEMVRNEPRD